jgi:hypothetical protein
LVLSLVTPILLGYETGGSRSSIDSRHIKKDHGPPK